MPAITAPVTGIPGCPVCGGTGHDEAFNSPCNCAAHMGTTSLARYFAGDVHVSTTPAPRPGGASRARSAESSSRWSNRYPGTCAHCGGNVPAEAGIRIRDGQTWATRHRPGGCPPAAAAPLTGATTDPQVAPVRVNRYAAACSRCGSEVPAEAGVLTRDGARWIVTHRDACEVRQAASAVVLPDVPAGHYAIPSRTGNNDLDFYRVDRPTEGRWTGRTFVKRVIGGHADSPVRGSEAREALERIAADPKAGPRYGQTIGRCCVCNRHLTDDESRAAGIGPVCRVTR